MRHAVLGYREGDISGVLETVVFLELLRRGYQVHVGKLGDREVDFVATRAKERLYVQVAYLFATPQVVERDLMTMLRRYVGPLWDRLVLILLTPALIGLAVFAKPSPLYAVENDGPRFALATFSADVTPPLGHPLLAGWREPVKTIKERLSAKGFVLFGVAAPIVLISVDWCELRNDAYDRWRDAAAQAAGTTRKRVLLTCVHQHDAPYADLEAQRLLDQQGLTNSIIDPKFHESVVLAVADAIRDSLARKQRITHFGIGQAKVDRVACNRRVELQKGHPHFNRYSLTLDPAVRYAPDGEIDPMLKTISFFDAEKPIAAVSCYATHPMSYYGRGEVSYDFVGMAREMRQCDDPSVFQIYVSGCSGDITAARYNDGDPMGRMDLAQRLHRAMVDAAKATRRIPLEKAAFRSVDLILTAETEGNLSPEAMKRIIADPKQSQRNRSHAALGLSWLRRCEAGQPIDLPVVDFGEAQLLLLPAEAFVGYQLAAQRMQPDVFVMTLGYGECAPGYIPTAKTRREGFVKEHKYCWVAPGADAAIRQALRMVLQAPVQPANDHL